MAKIAQVNSHVSERHNPPETIMLSMLQHSAIRFNGTAVVPDLFFETAVLREK